MRAAFAVRSARSGPHFAAQAAAALRRSTHEAVSSNHCLFPAVASASGPQVAPAPIGTRLHELIQNGKSSEPFSDQLTCAMHRSPLLIQDLTRYPSQGYGDV